MFKVVERFASFQGEGHWSGTPMFFIRLSQCPVGGPEGICHTWDGREFVCDTGPAWKKDGGLEWHSYTETNESLDAKDLLVPGRAQGLRHFCVTGGEPGIYKLEDILEELHRSEALHVETSGTVPLPVAAWGKRIQLWITLSPKQHWRDDVLAYADEIKLLVHEGTNPKELEDWKLRAGHRPFCLQPIDDDQYALNLAFAMEMAKQLNVKLGLQLHKLMAVR